MRNIYIEKKEKLMLAIYMILIFSASYIFYTKVEPIMICDTDDWNYISSTRLAIPLWGNWNPSKVFPETLMGLCGFFAAYVIYPLLGDYIFSLTYVFAFVVSTFIVLYIKLSWLLIYCFIHSGVIVFCQEDIKYDNARSISLFVNSIFVAFPFYATSRYKQYFYVYGK